MELSQNEFKLAGDHFICNIAMDENLPGGLVAVERDPRKLKRKPDAYVAKVERVGPGCRLVRPENRIVVERFEWLQYNLDDERIIAREIDVIILSNDRPAPGIAVIKEISGRQELEKRSGLYLPNAERSSSRGRDYIFGVVTHSEVECLKPEHFVWLLKTDGNQWRLKKDILVIRFDENMVLMTGEKIPFEMEVA